MNLTEKQIKLVKYKCNEANIDFDSVYNWIQEGRVTISQIADGILGFELSEEELEDLQNKRKI